MGWNPYTDTCRSVVPVVSAVDPFVVHRWHGVLAPCLITQVSGDGADERPHPARQRRHDGNPLPGAATAPLPRAPVTGSSVASGRKQLLRTGTAVPVFGSTPGPVVRAPGGR